MFVCWGAGYGHLGVCHGVEGGLFCQVCTWATLLLGGSTLLYVGGHMKLCFLRGAPSPLFEGGLSANSTLRWLYPFKDTGNWFVEG